MFLLPEYRKKITFTRQREDVNLLYRDKCSTGKHTTRKSYTKLHLRPESRVFHILTSEYIDDIISRFFRVVCAISQ